MPKIQAAVLRHGSLLGKIRSLSLCMTNKQKDKADTSELYSFKVTVVFKDLQKLVSQHVVELRSRGLTQAEISRELHVSEASISIDMQHIRQMAQLNIKHYVTQHLPEQYALALYALDTILRNAYEILQTSHDNREKLQALTLFKDTHLQKLQPLSNSTTIEQALQFIKSKSKQQEQQEQSTQPAEQQQQEQQEPEQEQPDNNDNDDEHLSSGRQSVF